VVFVCGPFMKNKWEAEILARFADRSVVGVNVSLPIPLEQWNPFDVLVERDSSEGAHPDLAFVSHEPHVPVVGVCLVEPYDGALVQVVNEAVARLMASQQAAAVPIDTRLDINTTGLRTKSEVESVLARMDLVVTTRLHGTVLALKHGIPALAIDPEPGGARIVRQALTIGWPVVFSADALDDAALRTAFAYCLSEEARARARQCAAEAVRTLESVRHTLVESIRRSSSTSPKRQDRLAFALTHGVTHITTTGS
jgi:hypothetical protein